MKLHKVGILKQAKQILRRKITVLLKAIPDDDRKLQSEKLHKMLFNLPVFKESKRVSCYISTGLEVPTLPILKYLIDSKRLCFVPRYSIRKNTMDMLLLNNVNELKTFPKTKFNIKQPSFAEIREDALESGGLDIIIVPGLAFTPDGKRLGYGRGFYDKYIYNIRKSFKSKKMTTISLAFTEQVFPYLPTHGHDINIDILITPKYIKGARI